MTFIEFLQERHSNIHSEVLDDELPDHFNNWLENTNVDEIIQWAEFYGRQQYLEGKSDMLIKFSPSQEAIEQVEQERNIDHANDGKI